MFFKKSTSQYLSIIVRLFLFILLTYYLYQKIFLKSSFSDNWEVFQAHVSPNTWKYIVAILLLTLLNWSIEAFKWQLLLDKIEALNFLVALKGIIFGLTIGLFIPMMGMRQVGRVLLLQKKNKLNGLSAAFFGNLAQIVTNLWGGILGFILFCHLYLKMSSNYLLPLTLLSFVLLISITLLYYNIRWVSLYFPSFNFFNHIKKSILLITQYNEYQLHSILLLSFLRYLAFNMAYLLLFWAVGIPLSLPKGLIIINSIFILQAIIPSVAIIEVGVSSSLAVFFAGYLSNNQIGIVAATFSLWLFTFALPAFLGLLFIFKLNLKELFQFKHSELNPTNQL